MLAASIFHHGPKLPGILGNGWAALGGAAFMFVLWVILRKKGL